MCSHLTSSCQRSVLSISFLLFNAVTAAALSLETSFGALACFDGDGEEEKVYNHLKVESLDSLTNGECMHFDEYRVEKDLYPREGSFTVKELQCLSSTPQLTACSACYLCHHHLHHDHILPAYRSALLSLQHYPLAGPGASCLSALYFKRKNFLRSSFYASGTHYQWHTCCVVCTSPRLASHL